jgi:ABC-2 type transport system ATP-binding protein
MSIIIAKNLSKTFKSRTNRNILTGLWRPDWKYKNAVKDVSFSIEPGECVAFLGPNGAGKTTTTKMMTGLIYPSSGELKVLGFTPQDRKTDFLKNIGLVMGNKAGLNWDLNAEQNFEFLKEIYQIPKEKYLKTLDELTSLLNLKKVMKSQVRSMSLGERMKCELVASILHSPDLLFLDEPTVGLDINAKAEVRKFLKKLNQDGKTIILTSHDMDDIETVCERVIIIDEGKIKFDGSLTKLKAEFATHRFIKIQSTIEKKELEKLGEVVEHDGQTSTLKVTTKTYQKKASELLLDDRVKDLSIESIPLEEIIRAKFS